MKKDRLEKWWIILLIVLFCLILGIRIGKLPSGNIKPCNFTQNAATSVGGVGLALDPDAEALHPADIENTKEQGVTISGRDDMTFPAGQREITVDFYNPEENEGLYYLTFELRLYDDQEQEYEVLYTSGLVEPGKHIRTIMLSHALESGVYTAVIHVQPFRMNAQRSITNNADIKINLIVK